MKVYLHINGYLKTFFEQDTYELELREGATLADLFTAIGRHFGEALPKSVWSSEKQRFRGPVAVSIEQNMVRNQEYPLTAGQHIAITRFLIGG